MLVTVARFTDALEAHIVKGRMEADDIPAFIPHENHVWANWFYSNALGGVRVQVLDFHKEQAKQVLRDISLSAYEKLLVDQEGEFNDIKCPRCDSTNGVVKGWGPRLALVFVYIFSIPIPYSIHSYWCLECHNQWRAKGWEKPSMFFRLISLPFFVVGFIYVSTKSFLNWYRWKDIE